MTRRAPVMFQWTVFPAFFFGSLGLAIWLIGIGVAPPMAIVPPLLGSFLLLAILERIYPLHSDWNRSRGDIKVDAAHYLVSGGSSQLATGLSLSLLVAVAGWLSARLGFGLWPVEWPLLAQVGLALVLGELPTYWLHRLQHETDLLWRFHAVHHSAPRLYWLNAGRFHPLDLIMNGVAYSLVLIPLGATLEVIALFGLAGAVHGIFQHANLQLRCGPLNWFFSMAELHRWHHSKTIVEANTNYGQTCILWDVVFGTRFLPVNREPPEDIGIAALPDFPMGYWAHLASPFRWTRVKRESAPGFPEPVASAS